MLEVCHPIARLDLVGSTAPLKNGLEVPTGTQLREIFNALGDGVFIADPEGRYIQVNPAGCAMMGYTSDEILTLTLPDLLDPSEVPRLPETIASFDGGGVRRSEWRFRRKDGSTFIRELVSGRLPDGRFQSIVRDMTERVERERHEQLLKQEAAHCAKNILAVVQALARQTANSSPASFVQSFESRVAGLAASYDLFLRNAWGHISLDELVEAQMAPFPAVTAGRFQSEGPEVHLSPSAAQAIGMALHELATNAIKYGAYANAQGSVSVR